MRTGWMTVVVLLVCCAMVQAMERFEIVTTAEMRQLLEDRNQGKTDFLLVNTLDRMISDYHTIPGSINIPWTEIQERAAELGADKDGLIITYCMGYR